FLHLDRGSRRHHAGRFAAHVWASQVRVVVPRRALRLQEKERQVMPARLLAYGGTSFSERRRIGQWPAVPEATLRDPEGLTATSWCYGVGTLGKQPFVILRQRQNIEQRGGYPFSLLLDPGEEVWQRFGWNGAALVAAILQNEPNMLLQTPERCSA